MNSLPILCFWVTVFLGAVLYLRWFGLDFSIIILLMLAVNVLSILHGQIDAGARQGRIGMECLLWPAVPALALVVSLLVRWWFPAKDGKSDAMNGS